MTPEQPPDIVAENARLHEELAETRRLYAELQAAFVALGKRFNRLAVEHSKLTGETQ